MTTVHSSVDVTVDELTVEQGRDLFDKAAREALGVSGDEFIRAYNADELPEEWSAQAINRLEFLLPFAR